jgi:uncharacterized hydrophobic protein (TIGR00271 family)
MVVTLYIDSDSHLPQLLHQGLRLAILRGPWIRVVIPAGRKDEDGCAPMNPQAPLAQQIRSCLDEELGSDGWIETSSGSVEDSGSADQREGTEVIRIGLFSTTQRTKVAVWLNPPDEESSDLLVAVLPGNEREAGENGERRERIYEDALCELLLLRPGSHDHEANKGVLLTLARGPHARAATHWAELLEGAGLGPVRALVVQPEIGADSRGVGRRTVNHLLETYGGEHARNFKRVVVVSSQRNQAIAEACKDGEGELLLVGASKLGGLSQRLRGTVAEKVLRSAPQASVAVIRAAVPLHGRTQRALASWIQRRVPQLEREDRLALVERVQSNSHWDFDFVTLMSLSTLIAASGLIVNSAAVIIGAMLVAPLMTPIMGVGMALVQGNPQLLRLAMRSVGLGFLTALLISVLLGAVAATPGDPTHELLARDWPGLLDLFVAFVAGLAGVYSSCRSNLLAALPGVAIAAALVPPIATAGVALSIGEFDLALGASLLFLANFVAIVLASAFGLWAVGMREGQSGSRLTRISGTIICILALCLGIGLSQHPDLREGGMRVPEGLLEALEGSLGDQHRILALQLESDGSNLRATLELGGSEPPTEELVSELREVAQSLLAAPVSLRVHSQWEMESRAPLEGLP